MPKILQYRVARHPKYKDLTYTPLDYTNRFGVLDQLAGRQKPTRDVLDRIQKTFGRGWRYVPSDAYVQHLKKFAKIS